MARAMAPNGGFLLAAMLLTGSRTAVAATGFVMVVALLRFVASYPSYTIRIVAASGAAIVIGLAAFLIFRTTSATPSQAVTIRLLFLKPLPTCSSPSLPSE